MDVNKFLDEKNDLSNQVCIITDGNGTSGLTLANILMSKGATVILGVEHIGKGRKLAEQLNEASVGICIPIELNLNSLNNVKMFAKDIQGLSSPINILIHNANWNDTPSQTKDGFEIHFVINYLSLFTLTGLIINKFATNARIITVVPFVKPKGKLQFSHFHQPKNKKQKELYIQSKVASMFFVKKLDEHFRKTKKPNSSILCLLEQDEKESKKGDLPKGLISVLHCATNEHVKSGDEISLHKKGRKLGEFEKVSFVDEFYHPTLATNLWTLSEALTGVTY